MCKPKIYLIGLGVMGRNLALNYSEKGIEIWGYDLNPQIRDDVRKNTSLEVKDSLLNLLSAGDSSKRRLILWLVPELCG